MVESESDFKITPDTPYLALTRELWGIFGEDFEEKWLRYNGTALYMYIRDMWRVTFHNDILVSLIFNFSLHVTARCRVDSRFAPSQWEKSLQSNAVSHWLGASLESAPPINIVMPFTISWPTSLRITMTSTWWRHQMEAFSALLAICAGNSPVTCEFPSQRTGVWDYT